MRRGGGVLCVLLLLLAGVAHGQETIRIGWVRALGAAPVFIGWASGDFDRAGLATELLAMPDGVLVRNALAAGEVDVAFLDVASVVQAQAQGLDLAIVAKVSFGQATLLARRGAGITALGDLSGVRIASVRTGAGMDVLLRGLVLGEITDARPGAIVPMPVSQMGQALEAGEVDAAFMQEPYVAHALVGRGVRVVLNVNRVEPGYPWYVVVVRRDFLEAHPQSMETLLATHRAVVERMNGSPNAGNARMAAAFGLEEIETEAGHLYIPEEIVKRARARVGWDWDLSATDVEFIRRVAGWSADLGLVDMPASVDEMLDLRMLRRVRAAAR